MVGVAALIHNDEGRLLLLKRTDNLCWGPPGGSTEPGERLEEAVRREVFEETRLELDKLELFGVFSGPEYFYTYPNGDQVFNVTVMYSSQLHPNRDPSITLDHEHSEWQWFAIGKIPSPISPPIVPILDEYISKYPHMRRTQ